LTIIKKELPLKVLFKESYFYMHLYVLFRYDIVERKKKKLENINLMYTFAKTPTLIHVKKNRFGIVWSTLLWKGCDISTFDKL